MHQENEIEIERAIDVTVPVRARIASIIKLLIILIISVTVPVRARIASAKGYNSCNKNKVKLYNSQIYYTDKSFAFQ